MEIYFAVLGIVLAVIGYCVGQIVAGREVRRLEAYAWHQGYYAKDEDIRHKKITPNPYRRSNR